MKTKNIIKLLIMSIFSLIILCSCSFDYSLLEDYLYEDTNSNFTSNSDNFTVHYLDVGQGDSIFIELPDSQTMLIDAADKNYGEGIVEYINDCGYSQIDYLIATHPHADHIGSMSYVVDNMDITSIYMPKVSTTTKTYENLLTSIADKGLKIKSTTAGMNIVDENGLMAEAVAPVTIDENNLNNCSIVLKITYGSTSFLFTGDAEMEELESITSDISADVLKVGHHGSDTSTNEEFLWSVNPSIAVISVGEDNDYGHPHKSTMNYLQDFGCEIYRTDEDNTITITSDGESLTVNTHGSSIEKGD